MKKKNILISFILSLFLIVLSSCKSGNVRGEVYKDSEKYLAGNQTYNESIKKLDLSWSMGKVTLIQDVNVQAIEIIEENELEDKYKVHTYLNDGTLYVKFWESGAKGFVLGTDKYVTIKYPSAVELIDIVVTSGTLEADYLASKKIDVVRTSGTTKINKIEADELLYTQTSGNTNIQELSCEKAQMNSTSGRVIINKVDCEMFNLVYTSGGINLKFNTAVTVNVSGTSGTQTITLPESGASVHYHVTSGSFRCSRDGREEDRLIVIGDGDAQFDLSVSSGNIVIK